MHDSTIWLQGVQTHNLNNLDVRLPLGQLVAVCGVSGSGKSSLVFHTLHAEAYRRYIDSLSSFARQYLKTMPKPPLAAAHHLPPSIAVQQNASGYNNRSTVGSFTEIAALLRTIFTHECATACVHGHGPLKAHTPSAIVELMLRQYHDQRLMILAPLSALLADAAAATPAQRTNQTARQPKDPAASRARTLLTMLQEQALLRLERADFSVVKISELGDAELAELPQCAVVMDRLTVTSARSERLGEAVARSLELSRGMVRIRPLARPEEARVYKTSLSCSQCDDEATEPETKYFSYTHPAGACPVCKGYGQANVWAWPKILADANTIADLKLWKYNSVRRYRQRLQASMAEHLDPTKPLADFSDDELALLKWGHAPTAAHTDVVADPGTLSPAASSSTQYLGLAGLLNRLNQAKSLSMRMMLARYKTYIRCHHCSGTRLNPWIQRYTMKQGTSQSTFTDLLAMPVAELRSWLAAYFQDKQGSAPARVAYTELAQKLGYLEAIGLSYLSMDRPTRSLSGGEIQRLRMTKCLGLNLCQTLYCLDEPTAGLHPLDTQKLIKVMHLLKDQGNTVVVVEHDPSVLAASDYLIEIGPLAGAAGGEICFAGHPTQSKNLAHTRCLDPLADDITPATAPRTGHAPAAIRLTGVRTHNLKAVDITIPLRAITGVCGVSGSGKTSLIRHTLYAATRRALGQTAAEPAATYTDIELPPGAIHDVLLMSQKPLGRTSRSHIASYLDIWSIIRQRFAATASARRGRWTASDFSLNTGSGRCETCLGLGLIKEDISFLGELNVTCGDCAGQRYKAQLLDVTYQGKSIADVLKLTVSEASEFFADSGKISHVLAEVAALGLGYLTLGQTTSTFSGGEAQRLKILKLIIAATASQPKLLIFDEPTGGLSENDIPYLWRKFQRLVQLGHTVIIVEHHLRILKSVSWLIEIGPHAASGGGEIIYQGPPGQLLRSKHLASSAIAPFMYPDELSHPSAHSPPPS